MNTTQEYSITNPFRRNTAMEELPEREAINGFYPDVWADEETELEAQGIFTPVSYIYPDDFNFFVEELPEVLDVTGYYPNND